MTYDIQDNFLAGPINYSEQFKFEPTVAIPKQLVHASYIIVTFFALHYCATLGMCQIWGFSHQRVTCVSLCAQCHISTPARVLRFTPSCLRLRTEFFVMSCVRPHFDIRAIPPWSTFGLCANGAVALLHILL